MRKTPGAAGLTPTHPPIGVSKKLKCPPLNTILFFPAYIFPRQKSLLKICTTQRYVVKITFTWLLS